MKLEKINSRNISFLSDESRLKGKADLISFCENREDVKSALREALKRNYGVTVQGARTGITGGAVPAGCDGFKTSGMLVVNLSKMKQIEKIRKADSGFRITSGAGLTLYEIENILNGDPFDASSLDLESLENLDIIRRGKYFFPPDPTEKSASIGGIVSNCASGSRSFHYGSARNYINTLSVLLPDSSELIMKRGCPSVFFTREENPLRKLPALRLPECKNAAGLFIPGNGDIIDLFIGSEGILGIITEIEFQIVPEPESVTGVLIFPADRNINLHLSEYFREYRKKEFAGGAFVAAVEYFDRDALALVKSFVDGGCFKSLFPFPSEKRGGALYIEIHSSVPGGSPGALDKISDIIKEMGICERDVYVSEGEKELLRMKEFRHSVPESVNMSIDSIRRGGADITKLGTDFSVPDPFFAELFNYYYSSLEKSMLKSAVFGHIGDNHLHVNILPETEEDYIEGKSIIKEWGRRVVEMGGSVSAEHGTGRLKKGLLREMYGDEGIEKIRSVKMIFDPEFMMNRGVMI